MFLYVEQPAIKAGPLTIHGFGLLVAAGILVGYWLALRRMRMCGLDTGTGSALVMWMVVAGLAGSHLASLALSGAGTAFAQPATLVRIWDGMSSFGGLLAGAAAGLWFLARRKRPSRETVGYFDAIAFAFPVAWMFGRAGCAIAHDHPGIRTSSILAVQYPDGPRFDAGLLEFFASGLIAILFVALAKRPRLPGFYIATLLILYGPMRFLIETVRIGETTYFGMTTGQYGAAVATLAGVSLMARSRAGRLIAG